MNLPCKNQQSASFGPFDRQVVILNTDGKTFTLLQNPQAMRLKKAGYIEDRKFVIQPSQQVIDDALEGKEGLGDALKGIFGGVGGGGGGGSGDGDVTVSGSPSSVTEASDSVTESEKMDAAAAAESK
jgi:hypothetical protein